MPYSEFVEHAAYYRIAPWGDDWQQAATTAWAGFAPHVKKRMKPDDFMPKFKLRKPRQTTNQMVSVLQQMAAQIPGCVKRVS